MVLSSRKQLTMITANYEVVGSNKRSGRIAESQPDHFKASAISQTSTLVSSDGHCAPGAVAPAPQQKRCCSILPNRSRSRLSYRFSPETPESSPPPPIPDADR